MGSQHLDYWHRSPKCKTKIKLRGITMINNQDNEKQMVSLVQKILTATPQHNLFGILQCTQFCSEFCSGRKVRHIVWPYVWSNTSLNIFYIQTFLLVFYAVYLLMCTAPNTDPVYHEVVIIMWTNRTWITYETWRTQTQLLRYENVRVCRPEVTQHADPVNLSKAAWVIFNGTIKVRCYDAVNM